MLYVLDVSDVYILVLFATQNNRFCRFGVLRLSAIVLKEDKEGK